MDSKDDLITLTVDMILKKPRTNNANKSYKYNQKNKNLIYYTSHISSNLRILIKTKRHLERSPQQKNK